LLKSAELNNEESDTKRFMKLETILNSEIPINAFEYYKVVVMFLIISLENYKDIFNTDYEGYENMITKYSIQSKAYENLYKDLYKDYFSFKKCNCKIITKSKQVQITINDINYHLVSANRLLFFDLCLNMEQLLEFEIINSQIHIENIEYKVIDDLIILKNIKNLDSLFIN
jgi:hypothetical protein